MVRITADSTCDLGVYGEQRNVAIMPLTVILGEDFFRDGVNITPQEIFDYVSKTGTLPKTSAPSIGEYEEFFGKFVGMGDTVIHFDISAKSSSSYEHAAAAAKKFPGKVFAVDTKALSSGQGLLVMKAYDLLQQGMEPEKVVETVNALRPKVNTSFIPDRLDYLYKGGRCSRMAMYGANLLKIHPLISMDDGQLVPGKKYRGNMDKCITAYIRDLAEKYPNYDKTRCFITHSSADASLVETAKKQVKEIFSFDEVLETVAGSVITGHCGRNTLGVLFIAE